MTTEELLSVIWTKRCQLHKEHLGGKFAIYLNRTSYDQLVMSRDEHVHLCLEGEYKGKMMVYNMPVYEVGNDKDHINVARVLKQGV